MNENSLLKIGEMSEIATLSITDHGYSRGGAAVIGNEKSGVLTHFTYLLK